ncbi:Delta-9 fatty acid desaturase protein [Mycena sanguinolenta]|uniref:E3 ubiquitin-protein ligase listerin n=1 Tax=Mycena sanguinolenta TaxID=230812 RepID=A0A8H7CIK3_9AGAR|nr:Delta-9 fatty acid desaturase protein [Mycena sanguinolenta]
MPPKSSSASSGTRKKHARKAAAAADGSAPPSQKPGENSGKAKEKKGSKKHRSDPPRPKVYIAPVKPTAAKPDPLDAIPGLAGRLPPELLVILRSLGKKAMVTKVRALEELYSGWVAKMGEEDEEGIAEYALRDAVPVWLHHVAAHLVHPARRVRLLTAQVHAAMRPLLADGVHAVPGVVHYVWALAAHDSDRTVAGMASASVEEADDGLAEFIERVILHPDAVYNELNPPAPVLLSHPTDPYAAGSKHGKGGAKHPQAQRPTGVAPPPRSRADEQDLESVFDRRARLRIAAFGALRYLLETTPTRPLPPFLASPALWSALQNDCPLNYYAQIDIDHLSADGKDGEDEDDAEDEERDGGGEEGIDAYMAYLRAEIVSPPIRTIAEQGNDEGDAETDKDADFLPLGRGQPAVRRAAWALVVALLARIKSTVPSAQPTSAPTSTPVPTSRPQPTSTPLPPALLHTLAHTVLPALWAETDPGVQQGVGPGPSAIAASANGASGAGMWRGGLGFLGAHPAAWSLAPPTTGGFDAFLHTFLASACNSSAANTAAAETGYAAVVVVVGSVGWEILAPRRNALFDAFWSALGSEASSRPVLPAAATDPDADADELNDTGEDKGSDAVPTQAKPIPTRIPAAPALTTALPGARARAGAAFVGAVLECAVFVMRRGRVTAVSSEGEGREDDARLLTHEITRVWGALGGSADRDSNPAATGLTNQEKKQLHIDARRAAQLIRGALGAAGAVGGDLLTAALHTLGACLRAGGPPALVCAVLEALVGDAAPVLSEEGTQTGGQQEGVDEIAHTTAQPLPKSASTALIHTHGLALRAEVLRAAVEGEDGALLVKALGVFGGGEEVWSGGVGEALDALLARRAYALLVTGPTLLFAYLAHRTTRQVLWCALLGEVAGHPEAVGDALGALVGPEARSATNGLTANSSTTDTPTGPLDALFTGSGSVPVPMVLLTQVLQRGELFLSPTAWRAVLERVMQAFAGRVESALALTVPALEPVPAVDEGSFDGDLKLLATVLADRPEADVNAKALLPAVYVFAYVLPRSSASLGEAAVRLAREMWLQWRAKHGADAVRTEVVAEVKRRLGVLVCSTDVSVTPEDVLDALAEGTLGSSVDVVVDIFPAKAELDAMLDVLPADPAAPSLAVLHPHLPPASAQHLHARSAAHDARGYASYARIVAGLLQTLTTDRRAAKENVWALRHVLALAIAAEDVLAVPTAVNAMFDQTVVERGALEGIDARAGQLTAYLLTAAAEDGWRARVLETVSGEKSLFGGLPGLVVELVKCARRTDESRECRVLDRVLRHVLQDADKAEADLWMAFAKKIEKSAPETCIAIVTAVSTSTLEPPRLERYRNELAADLLGISPSKANTQGLLTLRKLAASAPAVDSDVVFLPQQRSVNIFKACQQWIASDEDIEEELESVMTLVFFYLAPLLQNVPGTHWDLMFDVIESNLETASLTDDETLVTLARDVAADYPDSRSHAHQQDPAGQLGRKAFADPHHCSRFGGWAIGRRSRHHPRSTCRELVLSIVQDLPTSLITEDTLPKMCHLLADPSVDVQKMAYQLLTVAARKRTEHFVVEAGVDVDAIVKADLPLELLDILQTSLNLNQEDPLDLDESIAFGYLLGWMVVFDLFSDASLKVRLSYIDQLRTLDIIGLSFIPNLLGLLGVDQGIPKAFKLDVWTVDEYFVQFYESGSPWSLQVLAAHLYYRALLTVPSLIYNWVLDCKDRQLSSSIATYTSLHFSPVLIRAELAHVKSPESTAELVDDNLAIKVATAVNEVVASYLVDEHQLEIKLKIPVDWPLHKIEVKDVKRVGVEETRWRAWILAVQQTLWSQNGRIVDGLGLFKKNVTLHFEGQVECAICYSIISVMDGTLPKKPCRTCKNRFHSGCLYKWFSSSHSSSCPLCRSDIM